MRDNTMTELQDVITDCVEDLELYDGALQNPLLDKKRRIEILSNMIDTAHKLAVHCKLQKMQIANGEVES